MYVPGKIVDAAKKMKADARRGDGKRPRSKCQTHGAGGELDLAGPFVPIAG